MLAWIVQIPVRAGDHVYPREAGDAARPLAVFDATEFKAQKAEAMSKLGELQVQQQV